MIFFRNNAKMVLINDDRCNIVDIVLVDVWLKKIITLVITILSCKLNLSRKFETLNEVCNSSHKRFKNIPKSELVPQIEAQLYFVFYQMQSEKFYGNLYRKKCLDASEMSSTASSG